MKPVNDEAEVDEKVNITPKWQFHLVFLPRYHLKRAGVKCHRINYEEFVHFALTRHQAGDGIIAPISASTIDYVTPLESLLEKPNNLL